MNKVHYVKWYMKQTKFTSEKFLPNRFLPSSVGRALTIMLLHNFVLVVKCEQYIILITMQPISDRTESSHHCCQLRMVPKCLQVYVNKGSKWFELTLAKQSSQNTDFKYITIYRKKNFPRKLTEMSSHSSQKETAVLFAVFLKSSILKIGIVT